MAKNILNYGAWIFLALSLPVSAASTFPSDAEYFSPIEGGKNLSSAQVEDLKDFHDFFAFSNFTALNSNFGDGVEFFGVDQIFYRWEDDAKVYLMYNVATKDRNQMGRLYQLDDSFVYHGNTPNGVSYAILFQNISEKTLNPIIDNFQENGRASIARFNPKLTIPFVNEAFAGEKGPHSDGGAGKAVPPRTRRLVQKEIPCRDGKATVVCTNKNIPAPKAGASVEVMKKDFVAAVTSSIGRCVGNAIKGAWDSTIGFAGRTLRTICRLFVKPHMVWRNTVDTFTRSWNTVSSALSSPVEFSKTRLADWYYNKKPSEKFAQVCKFIGTLVSYWAIGNFFPNTGAYANMKNTASSAGRNLPDKLSWMDDLRRAAESGTGFIRVDKNWTQALRNGAIAGSVHGVDKITRGTVPGNGDNGKCLGSIF